MPSTNEYLKTTSFQILKGDLDQLKLTARQNRLSVSELLRRFTLYGLVHTDAVLAHPPQTKHDLAPDLEPRELTSTLLPLPPLNLSNPTPKEKARKRPNQPARFPPSLETIPLYEQTISPALTPTLPPIHELDPFLDLTPAQLLNLSPSEQMYLDRTFPTLISHIEDLADAAFNAAPLYNATPRPTPTQPSPTSTSPKNTPETTTEPPMPTPPLTQPQSERDRDAQRQTQPLFDPHFDPHNLTDHQIDQLTQNEIAQILSSHPDMDPRINRVIAESAAAFTNSP